MKTSKCCPPLLLMKSCKIQIWHSSCSHCLPSLMDWPEPYLHWTRREAYISSTLRLHTSARKCRMRSILHSMKEFLFALKLVQIYSINFKTSYPVPFPSMSHSSTPLLLPSHLAWWCYLKSPALCLIPPLLGINNKEYKNICQNMKSFCSMNT